MTELPTSWGTSVSTVASVTSRGRSCCKAPASSTERKHGRTSRLSLTRAALNLRVCAAGACRSRQWAPRERSTSTTSCEVTASPARQPANLLGALALAVSDRMAEEVTDRSGHSDTAPAALSALDEFLG